MFSKGVTGYIPLSTTNKIQPYTIFFIIVNALHVSGGFFAHLPLAVAASKPGIYQMLFTVLELLVMGEETARNM
jgi:hypothetical protein